METDCVIGGGGSAGCVIAARLTEDADATALLLEVGGRDRSVLFHWPAGFAKMTKGIASWGWSTVPQKHLQDRVLWFTHKGDRRRLKHQCPDLHPRNRRDYDG